MPRRLRTRIDFLVEYLTVPAAWQVGTVTFRPPGWLANQLDDDLAQKSRPADFREYVTEPLTRWPWSSADVTLSLAPGDRVPADVARELVRGGVALARLYQRACFPGIGMDHQTFGLAGDDVSADDWHWAADRHGYRGSGWTRHGVSGSFDFTRDMIRRFRSRPAFAFLDKAFRAEDPTPGSWEQRAVTAVRALGVAGPRQSQPMRIVLQAVALEALLGDDAPDPGQRRRFQAHPVSQRAAFVTCEQDGARLAEPNTACVCLVGSAADIATHRLTRGRPPDYWDWPCYAYWHIRQVFDARNAALHDARDHFPRRTAMRFEGRVDGVILATLDWVVATGATSLKDLDTAIARLPR